ncbi:hypothetical protein ACETU7_29145 [Rhodococcus sp. 3Y1]
MEHLASSILHPSRWSVRARSTVASTLVIAFCLVIAGLALVFVLANSLHLSALNSSDARATQLVQQLNGKTRPISTLRFCPQTVRSESCRSSTPITE